MLNRVIRRYTTPSHGYVRVRLDTGKVMLEHRALMENHLGRQLKRSEQVHHVDGDTFNNSLRNLKVLSPLAHRETHAVCTRVELVCAECSKKFIKPGAVVRSKKKEGQIHFFCSRSCSHKSADGRNRKIVHGTRNTYVRHHCRCVACTAVVREYQRRFR